MLFSEDSVSVVPTTNSKWTFENLSEVGDSVFCGRLDIDYEDRLISKLADQVIV